MKFKTFGLASFVMVLTACSSQPTQPTGATPAPAASTAPAAAAPAAPAAAQAVSADANGDAPAVNRTLLSAGYKPTTIKGEVYYCRTVDVTNTAFKKKVCLNETQIKDEERKVKEMQREMLRRQPNPSCMGPTC